jgi:hypothetical protein
MLLTLLAAPFSTLSLPPEASLAVWQHGFVLKLLAAPCSTLSLQPDP